MASSRARMCASSCAMVLSQPELAALSAGPEAKLVAVAPRFEDAFVDILGGGPGGTSVLAAAMALVKEDGLITVEAQGLTKRFGDFTAARDITFAIQRGEIFGLLGPNGAGKSTTFKMMCGLLRPLGRHRPGGGPGPAAGARPGPLPPGLHGPEIFPLRGSLRPPEPGILFRGLWPGRRKAERDRGTDDRHLQSRPPSESRGQGAAAWFQAAPGARLRRDARAGRAVSR